MDRGTYLHFGLYDRKEPLRLSESWTKIHFKPFLCLKIKISPLYASEACVKIETRSLKSKYCSSSSGLPFKLSAKLGDMGQKPS